MEPTIGLESPESSISSSTLYATSPNNLICNGCGKTYEAAQTPAEHGQRTGLLRGQNRVRFSVAHISPSLVLPHFLN